MVAIHQWLRGSCVAFLCMYSGRGLSPERKWATVTPGTGKIFPGKLSGISGWQLSVSMATCFPPTELRSECYSVGGFPNSEGATQ